MSSLQITAIVIGLIAMVCLIAWIDLTAQEYREEKKEREREEREAQYRFHRADIEANLWRSQKGGPAYEEIYRCRSSHFNPPYDTSGGRWETMTEAQRQAYRDYCEQWNRPNYSTQRAPNDLNDP